MSTQPATEATSPESGPLDPEAGAEREPSEETSEETPKTYDEEYVKGLRDENAKHRREKREVQQALLESRVEKVATDLADPSDLFVFAGASTLVGEDGLPDDDLIADAVAQLLESKPHLRSREPRGDLDQGARGVDEEQFSFNEWLRGAAG